ncbi:MAG: hypothetical protein IJ865_01430, partial [Clostridia bacterium]|nr:hypothetical protein [Clostridia bacterium]
TTGKYEDAAEIFALLGNFRDASDRFAATNYILARAADDEGNGEEAVHYYEQAGSYEDAEEKLENTAATLYAERAQTAREAFNDGDWAKTAQALEDIDFSQLPDTYADLPDLYEVSCREIGKQLFLEENYDAAYPYLQRAGQDDEVETMLASRLSWQLCGVWENEDHSLTLRADGTAEVDGEEHTWEIDALGSIRLDGSPAYSLLSHDDNLVLRPSGSLESMTLHRTGASPLLPLLETVSETAV